MDTIPLPKVEAADTSKSMAMSKRAMDHESTDHVVTTNNETTTNDTLPPQPHVLVPSNEPDASPVSVGSHVTTLPTSTTESSTLTDSGPRDTTSPVPVPVPVAVPQVDHDNDDLALQQQESVDSLPLTLSCPSNDTTTTTAIESSAANVGPSLPQQPPPPQQQQEQEQVLPQPQPRQEQENVDLKDSAVEMAKPSNNVGTKMVDGEEKSEKETKQQSSSGSDQPQEKEKEEEESVRIQQQQQQTLANPPLLQLQPRPQEQQQQQVVPAQQQHQPHQPPARLQQQQHASVASTEIVHSLFGPRVGLCWGDFSCQYNHIRGRLYASTEAVLFYSNLFGFEKKISLRYDHVHQMQLYRATSIQISILPNNNNTTNSSDQDQAITNTTNMVHYIFKGFAERAQTLQLLIDLWKQNQGPENIEVPNDHDEDATETEADLNLVLSASASAQQESPRQAASSSEALMATTSNAQPRASRDDGERGTAAASQPSNGGNVPNNNHNPQPLSILRPSSSKVSTPPSRTVSPTRIKSTTTTPTRLFPDLASSLSSSSDRGRRSKSLPPLHRRRDFQRSQSLSSNVGTTSTTSSSDKTMTTTNLQTSIGGDKNHDNTLDWDKDPSNSDLEAWRAIKASTDDPCIQHYGIQPTELACSLGTFFKLFLADDAPYSVDKYQRGPEVKDLNVQVTPWQADTTNQERGGGVLWRTITFRHPVSSSFGVGPSHAPTRKRQVLRRYPGCGICLTSSTTVEGLPGADCFVVQDQWIIEVVLDASDGTTNTKNPRLKLSARFGANFTKYTFLKGIIQRNINAGNLEWFEGYRKMVVATIQHQQQDESGTETLEREASFDEVEQVEPDIMEPRSIMDQLRQLPIQVLAIAVVGSHVVLLFFLLMVTMEMQRSQKVSETMLEELKFLRLDHGKLLELLAAGTKTRETA